MPSPRRTSLSRLTLTLAICGLGACALADADGKGQPVREPPGSSPSKGGGYSVGSKTGPLLQKAGHRRPAAPDYSVGHKARGDRSGDPSRSGSLVMTFSALAAVLGLFFLVMWLMRRHLPGGSASLPSDVMEVLGHGSIAPKQPVHLVRLGDRLLFLSSGASGMETLCEITDPDEVTRLAGLCHEAHPQSASTAFRQVFRQLSQARASGKEDLHG